MREPIHIEVKFGSGEKDKWVQGIVSHTQKEISRALASGEMISLTDVDGCIVDIDLSHAIMIRYQTDAVFRRRSAEVQGRARR